MLEGPVRDTVRANCLDHFETPDGILNLPGVGQPVFAYGLIGVCSQSHMNRVNHFRVRCVGYRLGLSLKTVG